MESFDKFFLLFWGRLKITHKSKNFTFGWKIYPLLWPYDQLENVFNDLYGIGKFVQIVLLKKTYDLFDW